MRKWYNTLCETSMSYNNLTMCYRRTSYTWLLSATFNPINTITQSHPSEYESHSMISDRQGIYFANWLRKDMLHIGYGRTCYTLVTEGHIRVTEWHTTHGLQTDRQTNKGYKRTDRQTSALLRTRNMWTISSHSKSISIRAQLV